MVTHEQYLAGVREIATARVVGSQREQLEAIRFVYGLGHGYRGVTHFEGWKNGHATDFVEIAASGEESHTQLAGTTIHELAHVLAGLKAGHGKDWKAQCHRLGLTTAHGAGQAYAPEDFDPEVWRAIAALPTPTDGVPTLKPGLNGSAPLVVAPRPCGAGVGTKGGTSRGKGSGSRLRKWVCHCEPPVIVRVASDEFKALCLRCNGPFEEGMPLLKGMRPVKGTTLKVTTPNPESEA
jgi:hypothetical protein